jgi:hypothetical protein
MLFERRGPFCIQLAQTAFRTASLRAASLEGPQLAKTSLLLLVLDRTFDQFTLYNELMRVLVAFSSSALAIPSQFRERPNVSLLWRGQRGWTL